MYHLADPESPKVNVTLTNPAYIPSEKLAYLRSLETINKLLSYLFVDSVDEHLADLDRMYGKDSWKLPTYITKIHSQAYCGETLLITPKPYPELLWTWGNCIWAYEVEYYPENEVCQDCVSRLDSIRDKQGYRPIRKKFADPDSCDCAGWHLLRYGCKCKTESKIPPRRGLRAK